MICFYHNADLDGKCSGAIVKKKFPDVVLYGINYEDDIPGDLISHHEHVIIVDFSFPPETMFVDA